MDQRQLRKTYNLLDRTYNAVEQLQAEGFDRKFDLKTIDALKTKIVTELEARAAWKHERQLIKQAKLERKQAREARKRAAEAQQHLRR